MSYNTLIESRTVRGLKVEVHYDEDPMTPRDWDNGTYLVLSHGRYDLPNEIDLNFDAFNGWEEVEAHIRENYEVVGLKRVCGYEHGALALSTTGGGQFSDPWDSGTAGLIFMDKKGQDEMGTPDDRVDEVLDGDVQTYNDYLNGRVYGYVVRNEDGKVLDSCWGFFEEDGIPDYIWSEALASAEWKANESEQKRDTILSTCLLDSLVKA